MSKRLEDPKDLNYSFRRTEGRAKEEQKKLKTQTLSTAGKKKEVK